MLSDDVALVDEIDFYNGTRDPDRGDAWERIKKFCEEAQKTSTDSVSPKSPADCSTCPIYCVCRPDVELNSLLCFEARSQLRA